MNREHKVKVGLAAVLAVITSAGLAYMVTVAWAQQTNLGPFETDLSIGNAATLAAVPANPSRRGLIVCNTHASQTINLSFGTTSTPSATVGIRIPGGNAVASCWYSSAAIGPGSGGQGAQLNMFGSGAATTVTVLEY